MLPPTDRIWQLIYPDSNKNLVVIPFSLKVYLLMQFPKPILQKASTFVIVNLFFFLYRKK